MSQHDKSIPPIPRASYLAWWLKADAERRKEKRLTKR